MESVGKRIHDRRKQQFLSADKLADTVGVSRSTMFRYESGDIQTVPSEVLYKIADALGTTVEYLLGQTNEPDRAKLTTLQKQLIGYVKGMDDTQCQLLLPVIEALRKNV